MRRGKASSGQNTVGLKTCCLSLAALWAQHRVINNQITACRGPPMYSPAENYRK